MTLETPQSSFFSAVARESSGHPRLSGTKTRRHMNRESHVGVLQLEEARVPLSHRRILDGTQNHPTPARVTPGKNINIGDLHHPTVLHLKCLDSGYRPRPVQELPTIPRTSSRSGQAWRLRAPAVETWRGTPVDLVVDGTDINQHPTADCWKFFFFF